MNNTNSFVVIDTYPMTVQHLCHSFVLNLPEQKAPKKLIGRFFVVVAVIVCHRQHFQTTSPLTPQGKLSPNYICSVLGLGD